MPHVIPTIHTEISVKSERHYFRAPSPWIPLSGENPGHQFHLHLNFITHFIPSYTNYLTFGLQVRQVKSLNYLRKTTQTEHSRFSPNIKFQGSDKPPRDGLSFMGARVDNLSVQWNPYQLAIQQAIFSVQKRMFLDDHRHALRGFLRSRMKRNLVRYNAGFHNTLMWQLFMWCTDGPNVGFVPI